MPRTRKPQTSTPSIQWRGRVANTTTSSLPQVYRFGSSNKNPSCQAPTSSVTTQSPLHVKIVGDNVYHVTLNMEELASKLWELETLDLSNVEVTLDTVDWPVTIKWDLSIEDWTLTVDEGTITTLTSTTGTIGTLTSTDATITNVDATDVSTGTLETSSDATVGWDLSVTGDSNLSNAAVSWTLDVTWATTVTELTASTSVTTEDLTVNWETTVWVVTAWAATVDSLDVTNWVTVWTTLDVTGNSTFTGTSNFTGDVTTVDIESTGTATLNDVNVGWNEAVTWTLNVSWATVLSSTLTVAGAATLSDNATVGWNLSVTWNQTVTWSSTTTWVAIFNSDITVAGNESVAGNEAISGTLTVADDVTLTQDLTVNGTTSVKALETDGSVDIDGTLRVTWAINGLNGLVVTGQVESDTIRTWEIVTDEIRINDALYLSSTAIAPQIVLQSEKWQPGGVAVLWQDWTIPVVNLPAIFTTCILKIVNVVFENSNTAVLRDPDIMLEGSQWLSNYQDIVWDIDPTIHEWEIILTSNEVETGSVHVNIAYPVDRCAQYNQNNQSGSSTEPVPDVDLSGSDPLP